MAVIISQRGTTVTQAERAPRFPVNDTARRHTRFEAPFWVRISSRFPGGSRMLRALWCVWLWSARCAYGEVSWPARAGLRAVRSGANWQGTTSPSPSLDRRGLSVLENAPHAALRTPRPPKAGGSAAAQRILPARPLLTNITRMKPRTLLSWATPASPHLRALERLPHDVVVRIGTDEAFVREIAPRADTVLCDLFYGRRLGRLLPEMRACTLGALGAAGVDHMLFRPSSRAMSCSPTAAAPTSGPWPNSRSPAHSSSPRTLRVCSGQQRDARWTPYDMLELAEKTLGIVGCGEIGRPPRRSPRPSACAC